MTSRGIFSRQAIGDSHWDWAQWTDVWPGKILPADIDFCIERHDNFLIIECKSPNGLMPDGQRWLLEALARVPKFTVYVLWGYAKTMIPIKYVKVPYWDKPVSSTVESFKMLIRDWFRHVD